MAENRTGFIRVTKDNPKRDRGLIAIDAICSIVENREHNNVSIMTMDGFWYDVIDDLDSICQKILGISGENDRSWSTKKSEYFRKKKMMPSSTKVERQKKNHNIALSEFSEHCDGEEELDVFQPKFSEKRMNKQKSTREVSRYLPSGEGEGHYDLNPKPPSRELGEGL